MPAEEAADFAAACLLPAVQKMTLALARANSPYEKVLQSLRRVTCAELRLPEERLHNPEAVSSSALREGGEDLLRRDAGPGWCREEAELVPLQLQFSRAASPEFSRADPSEVLRAVSSEISRMTSGEPEFARRSTSAADFSAPFPRETGGPRQ